MCTPSLAPRKDDEYTIVQECRHEAQQMCFGNCVGSGVNSKILPPPFRLQQSNHYYTKDIIEHLCSKCIVGDPRVLTSPHGSDWDHLQYLNEAGS